MSAWPLVWRATYAAAVQRLTDDVFLSRLRHADSERLLTAQLAASEARNVEWMRMYHERTASAPPVVLSPPTLTLVTPADPDIVSVAIRDEANGNARLAQHLRTHANALRREGKSPHEIASAMHRWETVGLDLSALGG